MATTIRTIKDLIDRPKRFTITDSTLDQYLHLSRKHGFDYFVTHYKGYKDQAEAITEDQMVWEVYLILSMEKEGWTVKQPNKDFIVGHRVEQADYFVYNRRTGEKRIMDRSEVYRLPASTYRMLFE